MKKYQLEIVAVLTAILFFLLGGSMGIELGRMQGVEIVTGKECSHYEALDVYLCEDNSVYSTKHGKIR